MPDRPYLFYELTNSLCATCYRKVEAKVVIQDRNVYGSAFIGLDDRRQRIEFEAVRSLLVGNGLRTRAACTDGIRSAARHWPSHSV